MDIMLLFVKDLMLNIEVVGMFIFALIVLTVFCKDIKNVVRVLRRILLAYTVIFLIMELLQKYY